MWGPFDVEGRAIVVSGGAGHLGRAMTLLLSSGGATVFVVGRNESALVDVARAAQQMPGTVVPVPGDVASDLDVARIVDSATHRCGRLDGWVNNAYSGSGGRLLELERTSVSDTMLAVADVIMATQAASAAMIALGSPGSIVNIASMYGVVSPEPGMYADHPEFHNPPAYGAAKAGVIQFSRYAGVHLAEHGLRVNSISPGPFPSPSVQAVPEFVDRLAARVPLRRIGHPQEVAAAVAFLLCDASSYITGHNLVVDGGWTAS